jgi:hypothetical protein
MTFTQTPNILIYFKDHKPIFFSVSSFKERWSYLQYKLQGVTMLIRNFKWLPNNSYKLSLIRRGFAPGFVNYKKGCTRLATTSDKVYQLLAHGRWFSPGTPVSSTTKTGRHDIAESLEIRNTLHLHKSSPPPPHFGCWNESNTQLISSSMSMDTFSS